MNEILIRVAELRKEGMNEEALILAKSYLEENPEDPQGNYQCAWCCDVLEREKEAINYYVKAIENGLEGEELEGAYLGLGSTYRCLGEYIKAEKIFLEALEVFPENLEFEVFYAMTLYNLKRHSEAMEKLLKIIANTSADKNIESYNKAILFYSDKLDRRFD